MGELVVSVTMVTMAWIATGLGYSWWRRRRARRRLEATERFVTDFLGTAAVTTLLTHPEATGRILDATRDRLRNLGGPDG